MQREYSSYAAQLTQAIESRLESLELPVPINVTVSLIPSSQERIDFNDHAPPPYPRTAIDEAIAQAIADTPTPAALPGTPLDRLTTM